MKLFKAVSERILKLFLSDVSAGACIIDHGCCCNAARTKKVNCYGTCVTGTNCRTGCPVL